MESGNRKGKQKTERKKRPKSQHIWWVKFHQMQVSSVYQFKTETGKWVENMTRLYVIFKRNSSINMK